MKVHLVDGTYELFRNYFGAPPRKSPDGREVGATLGLLRSLFALASTPGVTHIACAFDHVIESFRNDLYAGYKTGAGVDADLLRQFPLAERAVAALGVVVWPVVEFEADDALATAASRFKDQPGVEQVVICSPDKDFAQAVAGVSVVCWDRRRDRILDEEGVIAKFGVRPHSIPDWLALVGDAADGYPGIPGWGAKSSSAVLSRFDHLETIPDDPSRLGLPLARATRLVESLAANRREALLYRYLATLRDDVPLAEELADLEWRGAGAELEELCRELGDEELAKRVTRRAGGPPRTGFRPPDPGNDAEYPTWANDPTRRDDMPSAITWFQIPATDFARAKTFYETICGFTLEPMESPPEMQMWQFPADWRGGEVGGALVAGEGAIPSATGTAVFLNANPDIQAVLDRVEGAGGKILVPKTEIGMDAGYFAMIADTEGNTVGLHSMA